MNNFISQYKSTLIFLVITVVIFIVTALFVPGNFKGKEPVQSDIVQYKGASSEIQRYKEERGENVLWTNALFGGMPSYVISRSVNPVIEYLMFPKTPGLWSQIFRYVFFSFIMLLAFKVRPWLALVGAIGIGFATENLTILAVGHGTKAAAISYIPLVIAGVKWLVRKKYFLGIAVLAAGLGLQIFVNHLQITYYTGFMVVLFFLFQLFQHIKEKRILDFAKAAGLAILGAGIALGANSSNLLLVNEYAKESIRGTSELTISKSAANKEDSKDGLTKDYVFSYSMGWSDYAATFIPNYSGGDSDKLQLYYGQIGSTSGPKYLGVTMFILMLLGLVIVKGTEKWWLLSVILLTLVLTMGTNNFAWFNLWMYDYFPMYNKFRSPSMMIAIIQVCTGLLAMLAVEQILSNPKYIKENIKPISITAGIGIGLIVLLAFTGTLFNDFSSTPKYDETTGQMVYDSDTRTAQMALQQRGTQVTQGDIDNIKNRLVEERLKIMKKDGSRGLLFALLLLLILWLAYKQKIKPQYAILFLGLLILADLWSVGKRYLDNKEFKKRVTSSVPFTPYSADLAIKQDTSYYRVLDLTESPLNSNRCAYFHKSIGGYSAAKIRRFQDIWDWHLNDDLTNGRVVNNGILNMLNMKYFIYPNQQQKGAQPLYGQNPEALGNAWFVNKVNVVESADSAVLALGNLSTQKEAIVEQVFADRISTSPVSDSNASVVLTSYHPEELLYTTNSSTEGNVIFSEIYYDKGWDAYIDNEKVDYFRANYVLRGLKVPAGQHTVTFKFEPKTYTLGANLAAIFGGLVYLLIGICIFFWVKNTFLDTKPKAKSVSQAE